MKVVGVTGTNGKTTTTFLLDALFRAAGHCTGIIGTVEYRVGPLTLTADFTTPPAPEYQGLLEVMRQSGVSHVASEVSSHALSEQRVAGTDFDAAIFTNLTRDHLDYHGTMKAYGEAKRRLFVELLPASRKKSRTAIINIDDAFGRRLASSLPPRVKAVTFSLRASTGADLFPRELVVGPRGMRGVLATPLGDLELDSPLIGSFNLSNILGVVGAALAVGVPMSVLPEGLAQARGAPGRLERVENERGIHAFVDYAHSPDALSKILKTCRTLAKRDGGKLIVVFGCGGERDSGKRPMMGRLAQQLADRVFVTSDNPRGESPAAILKAIVGGMASLAGVTVEPDREKAIGLATASARSGDVLVIAGKGHEAYQVTGAETRFFDDREELALALAGRTARNRTAVAPRSIRAVPSFSAKVSEIAEAIAARPAFKVRDRPLRQLAFNPADVKPGSAFVLHPATRLERTPDILSAVSRAGARCVIMSRAYFSYLGRLDAPLPKISLLLVDDVDAALEKLAFWHRRRFELPVVAIHGSSSIGRSEERRVGKEC